jgi:nucleoid DNA-binding protein
MNFKYLVESCVSQFKDEKITKKTAEAMVRNVFDDISQALTRGEKISVRGFGTFSVIEKKAREYTEPLKKTKVMVEARNYPKFTPSGSLKEAVRA